MKTETCEDRIKDQLDNTNEMLSEIYEKIAQSDDDEIKEDGLDEYSNFSLDTEQYKVIKITFSTGGPADWIEIQVDEENYINKVDYHFQDWFDHAQMSVSKNSYLWQYAEEQIELYAN